MNKIKLPPVRHSGRMARSESRFSGPLSECIHRHQPADVADFERRWHLAQMRGWAWRWRESRADAAMLGKPVAEVAEVALSLALSYRNRLRKTPRRAGS